MKYLLILITLLFMACSEKTQNISTLSKSSQQIEVVEVATVEPRVVEQKVVPRNETLIAEPKVIKNVPKDIPTSCAMWSDGCNVCTKIGKGKASCTTNPPCHNKLFSCLQWQ